MKLVDLNPFLPRDPQARTEFIAVYQAERKIYRRRPVFWISLLVVLVGGLVLVCRLGTFDTLIMLPIVFCLALAHDTITSHFVKRLIETRKK
jgi:hypothetical protein